MKSATTVADSGLLTPVAGTSNFGVPVGSALTTWSVTLQPDAAKTAYHYVCPIHTGMEATLTLH